ncbi:MAG: DUF4373 domain-containing protein [Bacteroides sp.]|uniref:Lin1244/Lin1753 domain-containing protein n=1 Tax=Bacteroides sp. TaxID=29523 RepID=UPI002FC728B9
MKSYFSHDSDARSDNKIIALRIKHEWYGYGLYWALIEKLRDSKDYALKADYNVLAFDLRADAVVLKSVINDFGLFSFTSNGEYFFSESLTARMKPLDDKKSKLSAAGKRGNEKRWKGNADATASQSPPDGDAIASQQPPDRHPIAEASQDKIRLDKIRLDKIRLEQEKETSPNGESKKDELSLPQSERIDFVGLMEHFNYTFHGKLQTIKSIDDKRKKAIKARIAQYDKQAIDTVFRLILDSPFLLGQNDRNWKCDFDWIFKPTNFTKILEGNYNEKRIDTTTARRASVNRLKDLAGSILQGTEP